MPIFIDKLGLTITSQKQNDDRYMSGSNSCNGVIFLATVLSKMSQMFTEINSIYLQAMLNKDSISICPQFNVNTLLSQFQKDCKEKISSVVEEVACENEQMEGKSEQEKLLSSQRKKGKEKQDQRQKTDQSKAKNGKTFIVQPPHPPPSSYLLFFQEHRQKIAEEFPNLNVTELSKIASKCWKELTEQQKKPYHLRFNQEKQKYYEALKTYNLSKGQAETNPIKRRGRKPKIDNNHAKEPLKQKKIIQEKPAQRQNSAEEPDSQCDSSLLI